MKKSIKALACAAMLAIAGTNVYTAKAVGSNESIELQIDGIEYIAEGDGVLSILDKVAPWAGIVGGIGQLLHKTYCTEREWVNEGECARKSYNAYLDYVYTKYRCDYSFWGTDDCTVTAVLIAESLDTKKYDVPKTALSPYNNF